MLSNSKPVLEIQPPSEDKKIYTVPKLEVYGKVTSLTLGGSLGTDDSGAELIEEQII